MDDVSGVADNCKKFADFVTVSRKYKYHCIYVFHVIAPETQIWKKILSQTNIFNIFPSSVLYNTVSKILQSNCKQARKKYIPALSMGLHRVYTDLANTNKRHFLTIDFSGVNKNGPGRYRTQADNPDKQVFYFNKTRDDEFYNVFISERINSGSFDEGIYFQITRVRDNNETFDAEKTLEEDDATDNRLSKTDFDSEPEFTGRGVRKRRAKERFESNESRISRSRKSARPRFLSGL